MIYLYSGTPGSGKSYHMARDILYRCRAGKPVIANFNVTLKRGQENFTFLDNTELTPQALKDYAREYFETHPFREGAIRLYWDECQVMLGARSWNAKDRAAWVIFFTQHRKWGYDVYLITQFDQMLDKQIRSLIEYHVQHRKVNNIGKFGLLVTVLAFGKPVFIANSYYYGMKYRLGSEWMLASKRVFRIYNTREVFQKLPEE